MKNVITLFILAIWSVIPIKAQDTVTFFDSIFLVKHKETPLHTLTWDENYYLNNSVLYFPTTYIPYASIAHAIANFRVTEPTTIYGVAITMELKTEQKYPESMMQVYATYDYMNDTNRYVQVKLLNTQDMVSYTTVDSLSFDSHGRPTLWKKSKFQYRADTSYISFIGLVADTDICNTSDTAPVSLCVELYFNTPHIETDNFYIGFWDETDFCHYDASKAWTLEDPVMQHSVRFINPWYKYAFQNDSSKNKYFSDVKIWYYNDGQFAQIPWNTYENGIYLSPWGLVFPF